MTNFDSYYLTALDTVLHDGAAQRNERTGQDVVAYPGLHMRLELQKGFPLLTLRKIPTRLFTAEMLWFVSGARDLTWLQQHTKVWDAFVESDGRLAAAYGWRWRKAFGRDQLWKALRALHRDSSSRQIVVATWDARRDGLTNQGLVKNVPCITQWTANVIAGRLNLAVDVRSNDMMLGCPHDVAGFTLLAHMLANAVDAEPGVLSYRVAHAHIYSAHAEGARKLLRRVRHTHDEVTLPSVSGVLSAAMCANEALMDDAVEMIVGGLEPQYQPGPGVGRLELFE